MLNPWVLLGLAVAWAASVGGSFFYGQGVGRDGEIAGQAKISQAIRDTEETAQRGAAAAIAANKPINTTVVQKVQREVQTERIYQDCKITPNGLSLANEALTGRAGQTVGPSGSVNTPSAVEPHAAAPTPSP